MTTGENRRQHKVIHSFHNLFHTVMLTSKAAYREAFSVFSADGGLGKTGRSEKKFVVLAKMKRQQRNFPAIRRKKAENF